MKNNKIILFNLLLILLLGVILKFICGNDDNGLFFLVIYAFVIGISTLVNLIISAIYYLGEKDQNNIAKKFLPSAGLILLIGFSSCYALGSIR